MHFAIAAKAANAAVAFAQENKIILHEMIALHFTQGYFRRKKVPTVLKGEFKRGHPNKI